MCPDPHRQVQNSLRPYVSDCPVVCLDDATKQWVADVTPPEAAQPGKPMRQVYEYERRVTANIFMVAEPLAGWRQAKVTDRRTNEDFAYLPRDLAEVHYPEASRIVVVLKI